MVYTIPRKARQPFSRGDENATPSLMRSQFNDDGLSPLPSTSQFLAHHQDADDTFSPSVLSKLGISARANLEHALAARSNTTPKPAAYKERLPQKQVASNLPGGLITPPPSGESAIEPDQRSIQLPHPTSPSPMQPRSRTSSPQKRTTTLALTPRRAPPRRTASPHNKRNRDLLDTPSRSSVKGTPNPRARKSTRRESSSSSSEVDSSPVKGANRTVSGALYQYSGAEDEDDSDFEVVGFKGRNDPEATFLREIKRNGWDRLDLDSPIKTTYLSPEPPASRIAPSETLADLSIKSSGSESSNKGWQRPASASAANLSVKVHKPRRASAPPPNTGDTISDRPAMPDSPSDDPILLRGPDLSHLSFSYRGMARASAIPEEEDEDDDGYGMDDPLVFESPSKGAVTSTPLQRRDESIHEPMHTIHEDSFLSSGSDRKLDADETIEQSETSGLLMDDSLEQSGTPGLPMDEQSEPSGPFLDDTLPEQDSDSEPEEESLEHELQAQDVSAAGIEAESESEEDEQNAEHHTFAEDDSATRAEVESESEEEEQSTEHHTLAGDDSVAEVQEESEAEEEEPSAKHHAFAEDDSAARGEMESESEEESIPGLEVEENSQQEVEIEIEPEEGLGIEAGEGLDSELDSEEEMRSEPEDEEEVESEQDQDDPEAEEEDEDADISRVSDDDEQGTSPDTSNAVEILAGSSSLTHDSTSSDEDEDEGFELVSVSHSRGKQRAILDESEAEPSPRVHTVALVDASSRSTRYDQSASMNMSRSRIEKLSQQTTTPIIEISSLDPRAAAKATAFLKLYHQYVEEGWIEGEEGAGAVAPGGMDADERAKVAQVVRIMKEAERMAAPNDSGSVSMSLPQILMDAELQVSNDDVVHGDADLLRTPAIGVAASPSTPYLPGGFPRSAAPTPASRVDTTTWTRQDWISLDRFFSSHIKAVARTHVPALDSVDAQLCALTDGLDFAKLAREFLLNTNTPDREEWSQTKIQCRLPALQRKYLRKLEAKHPGRVDLSAREESMDMDWSLTRTEKSRVSFGTPYRLGAHSTPHHAKIYPDLERLTQPQDSPGVLARTGRLLGSFFGTPPVIKKLPGLPTEIRDFGFKKGAAESGTARERKRDDIDTRPQDISSTRSTDRSEHRRTRADDKVASREDVHERQVSNRPKIPSKTTEAQDTSGRANISAEELMGAALKMKNKRASDQTRSAPRQLSESRRSMFNHSNITESVARRTTLTLPSAPRVEPVSTSRRATLATTSGSGGGGIEIRRSNSGRSAPVAPTALSLLPSSSHPVAAAKAAALNRSRLERGWKSPRAKRETAVQQSARNIRLPL